ncbi:MAG: PilN domain-containing protein [Rhodomicrobium sp.]
MSGLIDPPRANFSRDLRRSSLLLALAIGGLSISALVATAVLLHESATYRDGTERALQQIADTGAQLESLRSQHTDEPDAAAIKALRQRIASLNALDVGVAPSVTSVLAVLEQLTPPAVALQNLDYDRVRGSLELVAVSESSEELTAFFDMTSRSSFFKTVRLVDKKQAGTAENSTPLFQARLSIRIFDQEPRT